MRKNAVLLFAIVIAMGVNVFAQDEGAAGFADFASGGSGVHKIAIGLGPEFNINTQEGFAGGIGLSVDYQLPSSLAAGLIVSMSHDFADFTVLELGALVRYYFFGTEHSGLFAQADLGTTLIFYDGETTPVFMGGLRAGYRMDLGPGYIEPYFRAGYPYLFGFGVIGGIKITIGN